MKIGFSVANNNRELLVVTLHQSDWLLVSETELCNVLVVNRIQFVLLHCEGCWLFPVKNAFSTDWASLQAQQSWN